MNENTDGRWFRSEAITWALGNTTTVKKDFLEQARHMSAPEVAEVIIELTGTVGGVTATALGRDAAKLIDNVTFKDEAEVVNCSGANLRVNEQMEMGARQQDPADIASGATNASYRYLLKIPFELPKALRPRDTRVELERFLAGGELSISTPSAWPTGYNTSGNSLSMRLYFKIFDGRDRELKSRLTLREIAYTNQDYEHDINGFLRGLFLSSKLTTTGYSTWGSVTSVYSRTMQLPPSFPVALLQDRYREQALHVGTNDEFLLAANGALPLVTPDTKQKIGAMMDLKTFHIDITPSAQTTPTNARLVMSVIKDRTPQMAAMVAGKSSIDQFARDIERDGYVVDGRTGGTKITSYAPDLARKLPIRLRPGR